MSKEEYEVFCVKCRHQQVVGLAKSYIETNPAHAFRDDIERTIRLNQEIVTELEQWLQDTKLNGLPKDGVPMAIQRHLT